MGSVWVEAYETKRGTRYRIRQEKDGKRSDLKQKFNYAKNANKKAFDISDIVAEGKPVQEFQTISYYVEKYLTHLQNRVDKKNLKPNTERIARCALRYLTDKFGMRIINTIVKSELEVFKNDLLETNEVDGINIIIRNMKTFFNFCEDNGYLDIAKPGIDANPAKKIKQFDSDFEGRFLDRAELAVICKKAHKRLRRTIFVFYSTGMRLGEFIGIGMGDFTPDGVLVDGKTGKRIVPLDPLVRKVLIRLVLKQWRKKGLEEAWRKVMDEVTSLGRVRIHDLRHTFASTYMKTGGTLPNLMKIGGWKNLRSVEIYTHPDIKNLTKTMTQMRLKK